MFNIVTITLATTSAPKAAELRALLEALVLPDGSRLRLLTLRDHPEVEAPEENADSMAGNARLKARFYAQKLGVATLADDSGLETDALNGAPGVHSARWHEGSDADRLRALLDRLNAIDGAPRTARYRCALALALAGGDAVPLEVEATCEGAMALAPRGTSGFGYDPGFEITPATGGASEWIGKTLGEAPPEVKASLSHRARAARELSRRLTLASPALLAALAHPETHLNQ